jgi:hypothetical protein
VEDRKGVRPTRGGNECRLREREMDRTGSGSFAVVVFGIRYHSAAVPCHDLLI